jgi:Nif-specific regulatory protein
MIKTPSHEIDSDFSERDQAYWRAQEILLLQQVIGLIGRSLSSDIVLKEILHLMSELLGLNRGRIVLKDEGEDNCRIHFAYGLTQDEITRGVYRLGEGITGTVLAREHLVIAQDIDQEELFLGRAVNRERLPKGSVAFIAVPLKIEKKTVGVLACHRIRTRNRSISDDLSMLTILATLTGQVLQLKTMLEERTRVLVEQNAVLTRALHSAAARYGIIGTSPTVLRAITELEQVSDTTASVLLLGESGTGKELFARALHLASSRKDRPFIKVNCAAIPETLFESELFGYERGAFTGAYSRRAGLYEQAHQGTLFLDEIGELPLSMQGKLLRALQEGTIMHLGGKQEIQVDVRVVAATNRELEAEVASGRFRQDLFYRLNVIPIRLPSLVERREDIRALALHFLSHSNQAHQSNVSLSSDALDRLEHCNWPGNVRELSNLVERVVLLAEKPVLDAKDLDRFIPSDQLIYSSSYSDSSESPHAMIRAYLPFESHSRDALRDALQNCGGNKSRAAQLLGLTARQFSYRCRKLGL